jgi:hypothetical protein
MKWVRRWLDGEESTLKGFAKVVRQSSDRIGTTSLADID